jgi:hypothetical protein
MKTIVTVIALIFGTFQMFASDLIITSTHAKPFSISIDGYMYHSQRGEVVVRDLAPGTYRVIVYSHPGNQRANRVQYIQIPPRANVFSTLYPNNDIVTQEIVYYKPNHKVYAKSEPVCRETVVYRHGYCYGGCDYDYDTDYYRAPNYYDRRR